MKEITVLSADTASLASLDKKSENNEKITLPIAKASVGPGAEQNATTGVQRLLASLRKQKQELPPPEAFLQHSLPNFQVLTGKGKGKQPESISSSHSNASTEPALDPQNGRLNLAALSSFVSKLQKHFSTSMDSLKTQNAQIAKLTGTLDKTHTLIAAHPQPDHLSAEQMGDLGEKIRDVFEDAAKDAKPISKLVSAFFVELKRIHVTGAARFIIDAAAEKRVKTVMKQAAKQAPGTVISKIQGMNVGIPIPGALVNIGVSGAKTNLQFVDEGKPIDQIVGVDMSITAKVDLGVGALAGGLDLITGRKIIESDDPQTVAKWQINQETNQRSSAKSASPAIRQALKNTQRLSYIAKRAAGYALATPPGTPTYLNNKKLIKGADNTPLRWLAQEIDKLTTGTTLTDLVRTAYPSVETRIEQHGAQTCHPLNAAIAMPYAGRLQSKWLSFMLPTISTKFTLPSIGAALAALFKPGLSPFSAGAQYNLLDFHIELKMATHEMFSAAWRKDMYQPLWMHARDEALLNSGWKPEYAIFQLYQSVQNILGPKDSAVHDDDFSLEKTDAYFYGDEANIPSPFRETILHPTEKKVRDIADVCTSLSITYGQFAGQASRFLAKPPSLVTAAVKADKKAAFEAIHQNIWGGAYPGGHAKAMKNPNKFIYLSYDAISKALACAGTHLSIARRQIYLRAHEEEWSPEQKKSYTDCIMAAERAYADCAALMDGIHFPAPKAAVLSKTMLVEHAEFRRHNTVVTLGSSGGGGVDLFANLESRTGDFAISNQALTAKLTVRFQVQIADQQINASRLGKYVMFEASAMGGADAARLLPEAMKTLISQIFHGNSNAVSNEDVLEKMLNELVEQLQNPVLDFAKGVTVQVKMRLDPNSNALKVQYTRGLINQSSGIDIAVPVQTSIGKVTVGMTALTGIDENVVQVNGEDLCIQILLTPRLITLVDQEKREEENAASLQQRILKDEQIKTGFFGKPSAIANVVDYFQQNKEHVAASTADASAASKAQGENEFHRYFNEQPFKRITRVANEAEHFAPGSLIKNGGGDPFSPTPTPLGKVKGLPAECRKKWADIKNHIATLKTADDALEYYCNDPDGRQVFDAYIRIMRATNGINTGAFPNVKKRPFGFVTDYRKESFNRKIAAPMENIPDPTTRTPTDASTASSGDSLSSTENKHEINKKDQSYLEDEDASVKSSRDKAGSSSQAKKIIHSDSIRIADVPFLKNASQENAIDSVREWLGFMTKNDRAIGDSLHGSGQQDRGTPGGAVKGLKEKVVSTYSSFKSKITQTGQLTGSEKKNTLKKSTPELPKLSIDTVMDTKWVDGYLEDDKNKQA